MISGEIVVDVFKKQVPAGLKGLAGLLKSSNAIDIAERSTLDAGGSLLNDLIYSRVGPKSQCVQVQGALIVMFSLLKLAEVFVGRSEPEVGIGINRVNLQCCPKMCNSVVPVLFIRALRSLKSQFAPLIELII